MRRRAGFTLAEVLIALVIFALLAAAGTAVLAASVDSRFAVKAASDRTADLQRVRALLKADVGQAVNRAEPGAETGSAPIEVGDGAGGPLLTLVRTGWANPTGRARGSLQRVEWRVTDGRLERRAFDQPAGGRPGPPQVLYEGVEAAAATFVTLGVEGTVFEPRPRQPMPDAVRVRLTLREHGQVDLLLMVGAGR